MRCSIRIIVTFSALCVVISHSSDGVQVISDKVQHASNSEKKKRVINAEFNKVAERLGLAPWEARIAWGELPEHVIATSVGPPLYIHANYNCSQHGGTIVWFNTKCIEAEHMPQKWHLPYIMS